MGGLIWPPQPGGIDPDQPAAPLLALVGHKNRVDVAGVHDVDLDLIAEARDAMLARSGFKIDVVG